MKQFLMLTILVLLLFSCNNSENRVFERLKEKKFVYYFWTIEGMNERDSLLKSKPNRDALVSIALDTSGHSQESFLACEILLNDSSPVFYSKADLPLLSNLYARVLKDDRLAGNSSGNTWGLPCLYEDVPGIPSPLIGSGGKHFVDFGETSVKELKPLLDDTDRSYFSGGQTATVAERRKFRVKDLAAFFICKIRNIPFDGCLSPEERDIAIEKLKSELKDK